MANVATFASDIVPKPRDVRRKSTEASKVRCLYGPVGEPLLRGRLRAVRWQRDWVISATSAAGVSPPFRGPDRRPSKYGSGCALGRRPTVSCAAARGTAFMTARWSIDLLPRPDKQGRGTD